MKLQSLKVSKATVTAITAFVYENRSSLSNEMKMFYGDAKGLIEIQLRKPASRRLTMTEVLERAYNIEQYVLKSGACGVETEFIKVGH